MTGVTLTAGSQYRVDGVFTPGNSPSSGEDRTIVTIVEVSDLDGAAEATVVQGPDNRFNIRAIVGTPKVGYKAVMPDNSWVDVSLQLV